MGALGEPTETKQQLEEEANLKIECLNTFNNCDYVGTITIKGSHKHRRFCNDFRNQFLLFTKIKELISSYSLYYCINYETHKCNEWIHSHFIFKPKHRSKVPKMRQEIYQLIEGHKLNKKTYKHRILIEKPYNYTNYINYMFKDFEDMKFYNIHPHYKLKSNLTYICPVEEETIPIKTFNPDNLKETKNYSDQSEVLETYIETQFPEPYKSQLGETIVKDLDS